MDPIVDLAKNVVTVKYEDIPLQAVDVAKMSVLDSIGTMIAGATAPGCSILVDQVREWGGAEESTVMMYGPRVPAHNAALVNSVMARALDFDDGMHRGFHLGASLMATALAVAERSGGASGKAFLTALVLGADLAGRINFATEDYHGFDPTLTCGVFGTTATAAKLLGLDEKQMLNALGLAFNESSGTFQSNIDGALSVRLNQGLASSRGVACALLGKRGMTGVKNVLKGVYGYFHLYSNDKCAAYHLTEGLGRKFYGTEMIFKRWPSCGGTLMASDAMYELVQQHDIDPACVEQVSVRVHPYHYRLVGHPFKIGEHPVVDAQFSLQYTLANVILRKRPVLQHFTPEYIRDPEVLRLVEKVKTIEDNSLSDQDYLTANVEVRLKNGTKLNKRVDRMKGHPDNPLSMDEIVEKYKQNVSFAEKPLPKETTDVVIEWIDRLEELDDVTRIPSLLVWRSSS